MTNLSSLTISVTVLVPFIWLPLMPPIAPACETVIVSPTTKPCCKRVTSMSASPSVVVKESALSLTVKLSKIFPVAWVVL
jgi:hypothetical protein